MLVLVEVQALMPVEDILELASPPVLIQKLLPLLRNGPRLQIPRDSTEFIEDSIQVFHDPLNILCRLKRVGGRIYRR